MAKAEQQLIPLENVSAGDLFGVKSDAMAGLVASIKKEATELVKDLDVNKSKDRKEMASVAYKVARSKTTIDDAGKDFAAKLKQQVKVIDGRRKEARDQLDSLRDEVRAPLDRWEENEQARIDEHTSDIERIAERGKYASTAWQYADIEDLTACLDTVLAFNMDDFEEFEERATEVRDRALTEIHKAIESRKAHDAEQAELEQFRKEKAEREAKEAEERHKREQAEREEQIRKDAADKARRDAEEAQKQAREKLEEEQNARKRAEELAAQAEENAKRAAEQARHEAEEKQRREAEAAAEEVRKREANTQHKGRVNRAASEAIEAAGNVSPATAKKIVKAIVAGKVPGVRIEY